MCLQDVSESSVPDRNRNPAISAIRQRLLDGTAPARHYQQAATGGILLTGMGNPLDYPVYWDRILLDASQVTNPSIDPLREPMELRTYLGSKPDKVEIEITRRGRGEESAAASARTQDTHHVLRHVLRRSEL